NSVQANRVLEESITSKLANFSSSALSQGAQSPTAVISTIAGGAMALSLASPTAVPLPIIAENMLKQPNNIVIPGVGIPNNNNGNRTNKKKKGKRDRDDNNEEEKEDSHFDDDFYDSLNDENS
ncbi:MAG: hypothetical protein ACPGEF_08155, partial [Endozoicomonas sp.]